MITYLEEVIMSEFKNYRQGVNLGGWLSQCVHTREHYDSFIIEDDIKTLSTWKIDHLRLPIDYDLLEDVEGNRIESGYAYIQNTIDWCRKYNLNLILDLHKTFGYSFDDGEHEEGFFDNESYQERFYKLWEDLAGKFGNCGDSIAFELLNEVTAKEYCDEWNRISYECIRRIRKIAPTVTILVGGYYNNSVTAVKDLAMPYDENIIYNFHFYEPLKFTHQGAPWVPDMDTEFRMHFEDSGATESYVEGLFASALETAKERNVCLYCGEYGMIDRADGEDAFKWYSLIHRIFDKYDIGHAAWSYKEMDFGLTGDYLTKVRETFF